MPLVRCAFYTPCGDALRVGLDLSKLHAGRVCRGLASARSGLRYGVMTTLAPRDVVITRNAGTDMRAGAVLLISLALFGGSIQHLRSEWSFNPHVQLRVERSLSRLVLLWKKWPFGRSRPRPRLRFGPLLAIIIVGAFCCFRSVSCPKNPDWADYSLERSSGRRRDFVSMACFWAAGLGCAISLFPFCFLLVAVLGQFRPSNSSRRGGLMQAVAIINVNALNLLGVPALRTGISSRWARLDWIEEACSGVRSLQATFMHLASRGTVFVSRSVDGSFCS